MGDIEDLLDRDECLRALEELLEIIGTSFGTVGALSILCSHGDEAIFHKIYGDPIEVAKLVAGSLHVILHDVLVEEEKEAQRVDEDPNS